MSSDSDSDKPSGNEDKKEKIVHYLPFKVEFEGDAKVQEMFTDCVQPHPDLPDVKTNYFRCRNLTGKDLEIDPSYSGFVVSTEKREGEGDCKNFEKFDKLTYWNWDKVPSSMDSPVKLQDWLQLSKILHEPISK